jgi:hypothetical protein
MPARDTLRHELLRLASRFLRHNRPADDPPCGELEVLVRDGTGLATVVRGPYDPQSDPVPAPAADRTTPPTQPAAENRYLRASQHVYAALPADGSSLTVKQLLSALSADHHPLSERHLRRVLKALAAAGRAVNVGGDGWRRAAENQRRPGRRS